MSKPKIIKIIILIIMTTSLLNASHSKTFCKCPTCVAAKQENAEKINEVDKVLNQLNKKTSALKSFQAQVEYRFIQPLLDSEKLQKGDFYYSRFGNTSKLRLNFKTSQIDDEEEEKYREEYIVLDGAGLSHPGRRFKGMWAVQIDYEMEGIRYIQLAEAGDPNKPTDVFDLINKNFPMIGFTRTEEIRKQFEISLVKQKKTGSEDFIQVHLDVKPDSVYKDDYVFIDFWVDKKTGLPAKIVTVSTEPATEPVESKDISEIKFLNSKFNAKILEKIFDLKIPSGFDEPEIIPLKKKDG